MEGNGRWLRSGVLSGIHLFGKVLLGTMGSPFTARESEIGLAEAVIVKYWRREVVTRNYPVFLFNL